MDGMMEKEGEEDVHDSINVNINIQILDVLLQCSAFYGGSLWLYASATTAAADDGISDNTEWGGGGIINCVSGMTRSETTTTNNGLSILGYRGRGVEGELLLMVRGFGGKIK